MTNLNSIRVIPFCGKVDEWPIWSEKFPTKAKRYGFKDLLLGKLSIPKADEDFDGILDKRKKVLRITELNNVEVSALDDDLTLKPPFNVTGTLSILTVSILTIPRNVSSFFIECPIIS
jgi:hypothetical protein